MLADLAPATEDHAEFLRALVDVTMRRYSTTRADAWRAEVDRAIAAWLTSPSTTQIVMLDGAAIGALRVLREDTHHQLDQLFLLPTHQSRGIGGTLVDHVLDEARTVGKPVRLRVIRANPARRLYERMGFVVQREEPERYYMEWRSP